MALRDMYEKLVVVEKRTIPDGLGGYEVAYVEGAEFMGSITLDSSIEAKVAEQNGMKSVFTLVVDSSLPIERNDTLKRKSTNEYFRLTSNPNDTLVKTQMDGELKSASIERFEIPTR